MSRLLYIVFIVLFVSAGNGLLAQNTVIKGKVKNADQREIKVIQYKDYISMKSEVIAATKIEEDGSFRISFFLSQTDNLKIKVGFKEASLYVEPGSTNNLRIDYKKRVKNSDGVLPLKKPLSMFIKNVRDSSVNQMILEYDSLSGILFPENRIKMILYQRDRTLYDSLKTELLKKADHLKHPYVKDYIDYRLGQMETAIFVHNLTRVGEQLLAQREVQYGHAEYMSFLKKFVPMYVPERTRDITYREISNSINEGKSYSALDNALGKDTIFYNEKMRELAAIVLLEDFFYKKEYNQDKVLDLFNELARKTKFERHKRIITRLKTNLKQNEKEVARDINFVKANEDSVNFRNYRGRYLLVNFFRSDCLACILEMDVMKKLIEQHENDIFLLSVSLDDNFKDFENFVRSHDYSWDVVHFAHKYKIRELYDIPTIPRFMLIGPEGDLIEKFFPKLTKGGLKKINELLDKRKH